ncbi:MAG: TldD/PmbA family protein [Candidatus Lokiarchaeota archaeon]|nr:TldD/PmbA family protein [Candidatus Lokiarchaeota archaeon]
MSNDNLDLLEKKIISNKIEEYDIYYLESNIYETQFIQEKIESEREVNKINYFIRILEQKGNNTGIGLVKGDSLKDKQINRDIEKCKTLSKINNTTKYYFPGKNPYNQIILAEENILKNPLDIKNKYCDILLSSINNLEKTKPSFGKFRVHIQNKFLKNNNKLNLNSTKTYFFFEFALKAESNDKLAEYWDIEYVKNSKDLELEERMKKWANNAKDALEAKLPHPKKDATVIFSPNLLKDALNPVLSFHASGEAFYDKTSSFKLEEKIADENFTIIDDGLFEGGLNSNPWDGEGNPHQKTKLIEKGIFKNRIFDQKYSILENIISTGNGIRTSEGSITNTISNLIIPSGNISLEEIISTIKEGYFIEKCSWLNPDQFTGSFGTEIRNGYYIKNGNLENPIKGGNLSGNVLDMLKNCKYISKEREYSENSYFPYIAFSNLNISI